MKEEKKIHPHYMPATVSPPFILTHHIRRLLKFTRRPILSSFLIRALAKAENTQTARNSQLVHLRPFHSALSWISCTSLAGWTFPIHSFALAVCVALPSIRAGYRRLHLHRVQHACNRLWYCDIVMLIDYKAFVAAVVNELVRGVWGFVVFTQNQRNRNVLCTCALAQCLSWFACVPCICW